jgi:hypothetical protein
MVRTNVIDDASPSDGSGFGQSTSGHRVYRVRVEPEGGTPFESELSLRGYMGLSGHRPPSHASANPSAQTEGCRQVAERRRAYAVDGMFEALRLIRKRSPTYSTTTCPSHGALTNPLRRLAAEIGLIRTIFAHPSKVL